MESRTQLDEGMMDTIKSKLSQVYDKMKKQYPNFDEVFKTVQSHKKELMDIGELLKSKKENGTLSKDDIMSAVIPLSKKVRSEVEVNNTNVQESIDNLFRPLTWLVAAMVSFFPFLLGGTNIGLIVIALTAAAAVFSDDIEETEKRRSKEYDDDRSYFAHLSLNGAKTAQQKDDWDRLWYKYGDAARYSYMSNVDREKYARMYRDEKDSNMQAWREKYGGDKTPKVPSSPRDMRNTSNVPTQDFPIPKTAKTGTVNGVNYNPEYRRRNR